jgi:hypothetical protein
MCLPYLWPKWAQDDKLSQVCKMQKMFQGKNASSLEVKVIVEVKKINVVDVNVAIKSKIIKD